MKRRVLLGALWLIATTLALSLLLVGIVLQYRETQEVEGDMRTMVETLGAYVRRGDENYEDIAADIAQHTGMRVSLYNEDGMVLADTQFAVPNEYELLSGEEFTQTRVGGVGFARRVSSTTGKTTMYAAVKTDEGMYIRLSRPVSSFWSGASSLTPPLLVSGLLSLMVLIPLSRSFAKTIQRPITDFSQSLDRVMDGGEKLNPHIYPYEELQSMAISINQLAQKVDVQLLRAERERKRLATILDSMKEGLLMLDWDENVLVINDTACRIIDYAKDAKADNLSHLTWDIALLDAVAEVKKTETVRHVEYTSAGHVYEVIVSPSAEDISGEKRGIVLLFSDMSAYQSTAKIRQEFFQAASHELKTPITSVRGFAEMLESGSVTDEAQQRDFASRILKEIRRMEMLIEDILMITRMESGEIRYEKEDIDFYDILKSCCEDVETMAREADVDLRLEGSSCRMYASPKQMVELAGNLITNAVKYNKPGGNVVVNLWVEDGMPMLNVYNTGEAIPDHETERIFERFYRIDKGRTRQVGGSGLGLAIVKHIAGQYGAKVSLIPHPGEGNTFQVAFPPSVLSNF